ncbi:hypothetical protein IGI04_020270 [Brassica rapa subsp. trilocularis]|uniref:Knottin scorpion toxin-like domain-containing protein n=1 Tax=Brassica rapa subsp. trilocularis TaxID=1813537 RepID=A0ABQ7MKM8_BRACM|nr:hypothetical protein IGI04_020270 [Brassica rapa subsp. trilocularis]
MVITMETLVMFVFTTFFIISFVDSLDCHPPTAVTIPANSPSYGLSMGTIICFRLTVSCYSGGFVQCKRICEVRNYYYKQCSQDECYCETISKRRR